MSDEALIPQELTPEVKINDEITGALAKVNITETVIAGLKEKYLPLTIGGQEDKEGYLAVQEARKECKRWRVLAKNTCKKGREDAIAIQNAWIKKEKDVTGRIGEVEAHLEKQETAWEQERDAIKAKKKAAEEQRFASRTVELTGLGGRFDGANFVIGDNSFEAVLVREADDDIYQSTILPPFKEAWEISEAQRIEAERLAEEERKRQQEEREAFEKKQRELVKAEERLKAQQEAIERKERAEQERAAAEEKAKADAKIKQRCNELQSLGLRFDFNESAYVNYDCYVHQLDITTEGDEKWQEIIEKLTVHIEKHKADEAERERQRIEDEKLTAIQRAIEEERERKRIADEKAEFERIAEEQRKADAAAQASDRDKWALLLSQIRNLNIPEFKSGVYRKKISIAKEKLEEIQGL